MAFQPPPLNLSAPAMATATGGPVSTGAKYFGPPATLAASASPLLWLALAAGVFLLLRKG